MVVVCKVGSVKVEECSGSSLWQEGRSFCCPDVVMVIVLGEEVFDVFDGVAVVLCEDGWDVLEKNYGCVVDGSGLK